jgi:hypothetical protein
MASALCDSALFLIGISRRKSTTNVATALVLALVFAISGCGGDDEEPSSATTSTAPATAATETSTVEAPTETEEEAPLEDKTETAPAESPEDEAGGAGDEEPARTLALFTAKDGRITPRVVRVPAFISIEVQLRSADGAKYRMRLGDVTLTAGGGLSSVSTTIDGLRPGKAIVGTPGGPGNRVRIEATAEPGP